MHVFDGILNGKDMKLAGGIDTVDDRRQRRRLSGSRGTRQQDKSAGQPRDPLGDRRKAELVEGWDLRGNHAQRESDVAALVKSTPTEPGQVAPRHRKVHVQV